MLEIVLSNRFKKDLKLAKKRGYNLDLLNDVVDMLARQETLPEKNVTILLPVTISDSGNATYNPTGFLFTEWMTKNLCFSCHVLEHIPTCSADTGDQP